MVKKAPVQLSSETDRAILREYLNSRMKRLGKQKRRAGDESEACYIDGAETEILMLFDELLGEEGPLTD